MDYSTKDICELIGIDPSDIESSAVEAAGKDAVIRMEIARRAKACPGCGSSSFWVHDHRTRTIAHPALTERRLSIKAGFRLYRCNDCGRKFADAVPFAKSRARVAGRTVSLVIDKLSSWTATYRSVADDLHISPTEVAAIFDRYYDPARGKMPRVLCIDECYSKEEFDKPYCLNLYDWESQRLVDILQGREKKPLSSYLFSIPKEERDAVEFVCIDMWETYRELAQRYFKSAKIIVDSFHVMQNLSRAVDRVRCRVMRAYDPASSEYHFLKKYGWTVFDNKLKPWARKSRDRKTGSYLNPFEIREKLKGYSPDLRKAVSIYDSYQIFNSLPHTAAEGKAKITELMNSMSEAGVEELMAFRTTLENWREWIEASFEARIDGRRISNGPMEGFNSHFKKLLRVANGMTNFRRFRARAFLCFNKDKTLNASAKPKKKKGKKRGKYNKKKGG